MSANRLIQALPQVLVLHGFFRSRLPAAAFPVIQPLGDAFHHVLGIGDDLYLTAPFQGLQAGDHRHQFHPVVGGFTLTALQRLLMPTVPQDGAPAAGPGVSAAGTVGDQLNFFWH